MASVPSSSEVGPSFGPFIGFWVVPSKPPVVQLRRVRGSLSGRPNERVSNWLENDHFRKRELIWAHMERFCDRAQRRNQRTVYIHRRIPVPCCLSRAQAPLEQVRLEPPSGVSDRAESSCCCTQTEGRQDVPPEVAQNGRAFRIWTFSSVTEVKFDHFWCHCLDERCPIFKVSNSACRGAPPGRNTSLQSETDSSSTEDWRHGAHGRHAVSSRRVTAGRLLLGRSSTAVVQSSESTKPPLQLGHHVRRGQRLSLRIQ